MTYTLKTWLDTWLEVYKQPKIKTNTITCYKSCISMYLQNLLDMEIQKITAIEIQKTINKIVAPRMRVITYQVLCNAFKYALGNGLLPFNPMQAVDAHRGIKNMRRAITREEETKLLNASNSNNFKTLIIFYVETGVRRSEALTIELTDIDYENSCILIRGTKTANSQRHVPISTRLKKLLQDFYPMSKTMLFTFNKDYVTRKFKAVCRRANIEDVCVHSLRHTFTTRCQEKSIDIVALKNWLGHADISTTINIYTHLTKELQDKNITALNCDKL